MWGRARAAGLVRYQWAGVKPDTSPKKQPSRALTCTVHQKEIKDTAYVGKLPTSAHCVKNVVQICVQPMYIQILQFNRKCYSFVTFADFGKVTHAHQKCAYRSLNPPGAQWLGLRASTTEAQVWSFMGSQRAGHDCATELNWGRGIKTPHAMQHCWK